MLYHFSLLLSLEPFTRIPICPVFDPDGHLRLLLGGPARLMQTKPPSDSTMAALKALYDWRDRVREAGGRDA